ncbi:hypothetical protein LCGC14_0404070 [marine sediment metagenome]|uniref:Uncharacterized protein n=1 Tax=marine sediment metagenome TaxID=412755 RepID=A0A0F9W4X2_9ZZZZ
MNWHQTWVFGWIQIASGVVRVLTFGLLEIHWCFRYIKWLAHREFDYNKC